jgi:hypothetical protein
LNRTKHSSRINPEDKSMKLTGSRRVTPEKKKERKAEDKM